MDKSLKEFTDLIRKKKLRKFKNAQYGAKFLEVMTESY
jgi:translation initiation factor 2 alpha subunit (eIF-2alpha)